MTATRTVHLEVPPDRGGEPTHAALERLVGTVNARPFAGNPAGSVRLDSFGVSGGVGFPAPRYRLRLCAADGREAEPADWSAFERFVTPGPPPRPEPPSRVVNRLIAEALSPSE
jgi:hypothetical protein